MMLQLCCKIDKIKFLLLVLLGIISTSPFVKGQQAAKRLICYYDPEDTTQQGDPNHFEKRFLKALPLCTHLFYAYGQIENFEIRNFTLKPNPSELKTQFPHLKIFLSLGGDKSELTSQYMQFLERGIVKQDHFKENAKSFLKLHHFDGLDLAFPFPHNKPRKVHTGIDRVVKNIKKLFTGDEVVDKKARDHKVEYTKFVRLLRNEFVKANLQLSMTVLPNVNSTWYFDIFSIHKNFDFINLFAFDFLTPERNPQEADYTASIYYKEDANRLAHYNIEYQVNYWINNGCPANKLNLGIASYGRAWKMSIDSGLSGSPVVESTHGAADQGKISKRAGLLSYSEICIKLKTKGVLREVVDKERKYGKYAFRPANGSGVDGMWISYDDPEFAGIKAKYVERRRLGGVSLFDLLHDDYLKFCNGPVFPILTRLSEVLGISKPKV